MGTMIANAFSLNMIAPGQETVVRIKPVTAGEAAATWGFESPLPEESAVGHADTARIISAQLSAASELPIEVPVNRATVRLEPGVDLLVAQYCGPRLKEGAMELPEGAEIRYCLVSVDHDFTPGLRREVEELRRQLAAAKRSIPKEQVGSGERELRRVNAKARGNADAVAGMYSDDSDF